MRIRADGGFWLVAALGLLLFPLRFLAGVGIAAAVHEAGHLIAIFLTGGRAEGMELSASGAKIITAPMEPEAELLCALAGPGLGAVTVLAWRWFPELAISGALQTIFNLLPVYPLDGGRAWRAARNICCKRRDFGVQ